LVTDRLDLHRARRIARRLAFSALRVRHVPGTWFAEEPLARFLAQSFAINLDELSALAMLTREF